MDVSEMEKLIRDTRSGVVHEIEILNQIERSHFQSDAVLSFCKSCLASSDRSVSSLAFVILVDYWNLHGEDGAARLGRFEDERLEMAFSAFRSLHRLSRSDEISDSQFVSVLRVLIDVAWERLWPALTDADDESFLMSIGVLVDPEKWDPLRRIARRLQQYVERG